MKTMLYLLVLLVLLSACATEKIVTVTKYQCYDNSVSDTLEGCPVQPNTVQLLKECTTRLSNATEAIGACDFRLSELVQTLAALKEPAKNMTINVTDLLARFKR